MSYVTVIYLASRSPRRRALLEQIGVSYEVIDAPIEELRRPGEQPARFVERMALEKARAGLAALGAMRTAPVLAADTAVVLDDRVLGKPRDADHAMTMLRMLSGRMHHVISAVALAGVRAPDDANHRSDAGGRGRSTEAADGGEPLIMTSVSRVWFREISYEERMAYWASGEPLDKAGAYAIQGRAAAFVIRLDGSYSGVVGLPLFETVSLLREAQIET